MTQEELKLQALLHNKDLAGSATVLSDPIYGAVIKVKAGHMFQKKI